MSRFHFVQSYHNSLLILGVAAGVFAITACGQGQESSSESLAAASASDSSQQALSTTTTSGEGSEQNSVTSDASLPESTAPLGDTTAQAAKLPFPKGSWVCTCRNGQTDASTFSAQCLNTKGAYVNNYVSKGACNPWCMWNDNGRLRCGTCSFPGCGK